jgi:hypothetical protein
MYSGMTRSMKAYVSTMLTESDSSIPLRLRHFKRLRRRNEGCKTTSPVFRVFSVLTLAGRPERHAESVGRRAAATAPSLLIDNE